MTIHSFRRVLRVRREMHAIPWAPGRAVPLPHPIPVVLIVYTAVLELAFVVVSRLPLLGHVAHLPMFLWWVLPVWLVFAAHRLLDFDGRDPHRWLQSWFAYRFRARVTIARRPINRPRRVAGRARAWFDEHSPQLHRGRIHGPATVRFTVPVRFALALGRRTFVVRPDPSRPPISDYDVAESDRLEVKP